MTVICPVCHSRNSVEACLATEAGQAYMRLLLSQPDGLRHSLARYILLWAPPKSEMAYTRRLRLAEETLALDADPRRLAIALAETVEGIMAKRREGDVRPLTQHNYLKRVLESVAATPIAPTANTLPGGTGGQPIRRANRIEQAEQILAAWAGDDQLRQVIGNGLAALLALPLYKSPEVAAIDRTASLWERDLLKFGLSQDDSSRIEIAFDRLLSRVKDRFPLPDQLFEHLPRGKKKQALPEPPPDTAQVAKGKEFFASIVEGMSLKTTDQTDPEQRRKLLQEQAQKLREG